MRKNILLTGLPKSGKSTTLERLIRDRPYVHGMLTKELREDGQRTGFSVLTSKGQSAVLASVNFSKELQVSKYGVKISNLDTLIPTITTFSPESVLYIDEIGQMQLYSEQFKKLVHTSGCRKHLCGDHIRSI